MGVHAGRHGARRAVNLPEVSVPDERAGARIQEGLVGLFPAELPSRKACKKALEARRVEVIRSGQTAFATTATRLLQGDRIRLHPAVQTRPMPSTASLVIGFEADDHAVVWKPAGWVTSGPQHPSLREALPGGLTPFEGTGALPRPEPVHRLDRATAGWVLIAKTATVAANLSQQVEPGGGALKTYFAVCQGVTPSSAQILVPLDGKTAHTGLIRVAGGSLQGHAASGVRLSLHTGRTHQIRRHLAGLGHPIVGDTVYGGGTGSLLLVCTDLAYLDPTTGERRTVHAPLPKRFRRIPWIHG